MCQGFLAYLIQAKKIYISQVNHTKAVNLTLDKHTNKVESNFINPSIAFWTVAKLAKSVLYT